MKNTSFWFWIVRCLLITSAPPFQDHCGSTCFNYKTSERKYKAVTYVRICGLLGSGSAKSFSTNVQLQREVYRKCISAKTEFSDALDHAQERSLLTSRQEVRYAEFWKRISIFCFICVIYMSF